MMLTLAHLVVVRKEFCLQFARGRREGVANIRSFKNVRAQLFFSLKKKKNIHILIQSSSDLSMTPLHAQMAEVCVSASVWKWSH